MPDLRPRPQNELVAAAERAALLYEQFSVGNFKVYNQQKYKFFDLDRQQMRQTASDLRDVAAILRRVSQHD
jgi:hypothetical protein